MNSLGMASVSLSISKVFPFNKGAGEEIIHIEKASGLS